MELEDDMKNNGKRIFRIMILMTVFVMGAGIVLSAKPLIPKSGNQTFVGSQNTAMAQQASDESQTGKAQVTENTSLESEALWGSAPQKTSGQFTVLLIGTDARPEEQSVGNCDTLILAHIDAAQNRTALLSIPRDTLIMHAKFGEQKINAIARLGNGWNSVVQSVQDLTGQKIDGYAVANFAGFTNIIDTLGGITINVEKNMYYVTGDSKDGVINLQKGIQTLNGSQALQYARFRNDPLGDITRTTRQQAVLQAVAKKLLQAQTFLKLPRLIPQLMRTVKTNISMTRLWTMSGILRQEGKMQIISQTLPGYFVNGKKTSYWKVRSEQAQAVTKKLFEDGVTTETLVKPPEGEQRFIESQAKQGEHSAESEETNNK